MATFDAPRYLLKATSKAPSRYTLDCVHINPHNGTLYAEATNGASLAIRETTGDITEACLIPSGVWPTTYKTRLTTNGLGQWVNEQNKIAQAVTNGQFPDIGRILTLVQGTVAITLDTKLLYDTATAIKNDPKNSIVTLLLSIPQASDVTPKVDSPIGILGTDGFGVIMPVNQSTSPVTRWKDYVTKYQAPAIPQDIE